MADGRDEPVVSVVIPSIGSTGSVHGAERVFVVDAVRSVLRTAAMPIEVIVVSGRGMPVGAAAALQSLGDAVRLVDYDAEFNFSATVNLGAAHARGRNLLLLNDDTEVIAADWLQRMVAALQPSDVCARVGAVGARLLFEDGTLQHAGHTYRTSLDHVGFGLPGDAQGSGGLLQRRRQVAGATAACLLTPADVYDEVGGFTTLLPGNYNDVDYCMKLRYAGYGIVYEPAATLFHYESQSRVAGVRPDEIEVIQRRWQRALEDDPYTPLVL